MEIVITVKDCKVYHRNVIDLKGSVLRDNMAYYIEAEGLNEIGEILLTVNPSSDKLEKVISAAPYRDYTFSQMAFKPMKEVE